MFQITIVHRFEFPPNCLPVVTHQDLAALEERLMSAISDAIAAATASADAAIARVQEDVDALKAQIADLQRQVDEGVATPEDLAALASLQAKLDALDPTSPEVLPEA